MSSYKVSEPSALKFLKANGTVVDENGNVVSDATDYWKKVYDQAQPKVAKYLHADGTIDENPGSGGADLEDNKEVTIDVSAYTEPVEVTPTAGKDGMRKATVTLSNISSGAKLYAWKDESKCAYTLTENPSVGDNVIINADGHELTELETQTISFVADNTITFDTYDFGTVTLTRYSDKDIEL